jgi:MSHA pilin protein MshD
MSGFQSFENIEGWQMARQLANRVLNSKPGTRNLEPGTRLSERRKAAGLSLIELIVFIVIVGAAVAGVLGALGIATRSSADPMIQKQALAIAEAVLEEVQLMPFTYCDPDDDNAATALNTAGCAAAVENPGPEAVDIPPTGPAETRTGTVRPFDNVNDYQEGGAGGPGLTINPISNIEGTAIPGLEGYTANVKVAAQALDTIPSSDALLITVTVTRPAGNVSVTLHGYRARYAPNALP